MSPLQLSLILHTLFAYISLITTLPITSKPLENTPEHLTWEAWLMVDSKNPSETEKSRKITPKSIFITPNFINNSQICPRGYTMDYRGQCIQVVSINADELLASRLESLLPTLDNDDDIMYDYDNYDEDPQTGPLQVNIPLNVNFDANSPDAFKADFDYNDEYNVKDGLENGNKQPFLGEKNDGGEVKTATEASSRTTKSTTASEEAHISTISDNILKVVPLSKENNKSNNGMDIVVEELDKKTEIPPLKTTITTTEEIPQIDDKTTINPESIDKDYENEKISAESVVEIDQLKPLNPESYSQTKESEKPNNYNDDDLKQELENESFFLEYNNETDITTTTIISPVDEENGNVKLTTVDVKDEEEIEQTTSKILTLEEENQEKVDVSKFFYIIFKYI